jgi:hypothetical protein
MILLWGVPTERTMAAVDHVLQILGSATFWVDQRRYDAISGELRTERDEIAGWIELDGRRVDLGELTGAYLRPYPSGQGATELELVHAAALDQLILTWAEVAPAEVAVVNRPGAMASNDSKPAQEEVACGYGFEVPETLVTNDPARAAAFWDRHGTVIYKSISGIRSIVSALTAEHQPRLRRLATCPTQLQAFVPGIDYRVHVVGNEVFATRIDCDAADYRYAGRYGAARRMAAAQLPEAVAACAVKLTKALGLLVAGIDLRLTPEGRWFCFEVNTSPGFSWFQEQTDQPIAEAIGRLLATGCRPVRLSGTKNRHKPPTPR